MKKREPIASGAIRAVLTYVCAAAMLCAVGIVHVAGKIATIEDGYQLGQLQQQQKHLERENAALGVELATLRSAAHIETTARTKLNMVPPSPQQIFAIGGPLAPDHKTSAKPLARAQTGRPRGTQVAWLAKDP